MTDEEEEENFFEFCVCGIKKLAHRLYNNYSRGLFVLQY